MTFSSLIFILLFFVVLIAVQYLCPNDTVRNYVLLGASLLFFLWGGIGSLLLVAALSVLSWFTGLRIGEASDESTAKRWLAIGVGVIVLALLISRVWRLFPFAGGDAAAARYVVPMGLAFYGLSLISYLVDVYRGTTAPEGQVTRLLLYTCLFPKAAGGPVVRYGAMRKQLAHRKLKGSAMSRGLMRFSVGLAKKTVLADSCGAAADHLLGTDVTALSQAPVLAVWFGGIFFMLQVCLDLSAYADMAIGMGDMLGFRFPENFNYPYVARTLREFWHRWNMTVVDFFKDYLFAPLGGSGKGTAMEILNLVIVWAVFGLWHGRTVNFVLWAMYCLILLLVEKLVLKDGEIMNPVVSHIWVAVTMFLGFYLYRFGSLAMLGTGLKGLLGLNGAGFVTLSVAGYLGRHLLLLLFGLMGVIPVMPLAGNMLKQASVTNRAALYVRAVWNAVGPVLLLILSVMAMVGCQVPSFLYFQF